ncbi:MAG: efflux RND transporter permease subunit [Chloroflexota bacterium]
MIERAVELCLQKRLIVLLVTLMVFLYGMYSWTQLKLEAYPDVGDVTVIVTTQARGLAAEEVEQQITIPLERVLASTPGLVTIRSSSTFALSLITLVFKDGVEDYWARQRVLERVSQAPLPSSFQPALGPLTSPVGEILRYTLESDDKTLAELSEIQRWIVVPALNQVPGVASVANFGGLTRQFQLEIDPLALQRYNLGLTEVANAITSNSASSGGSRITRGEQSYVIRSIGLVRNLEDLGNIVVTESKGTPVLTRDLGTPRLASQEREGLLGKDHNSDTIQGTVQMLKGENAGQVLRAVHERLEQLEAELAPQGVRIVTYLDRNELVDATVEKVGHTVGEGVTLVFVVLILFLGSPRSAVVVAITIPVALSVTFILMNLTRLPANLLSLGSIDFGVIVDGAIVVTEAILRVREHNPTRPLETDTVQFVVRQVVNPIFFATIIIITAYLPLLGLERVEAKLFSPVAYTISYALIGALLCSLLVTPGLAFMAFRKPAPVFHNPVLEYLDSRYRYLLATCLEKPRIIYAAAGAAFLGVIIAGATIGREFLPNLDEGSLWLQVQLPSGISMSKAQEMARDLRNTVLEFPEVSFVVTQIGRNDDRTDPWTTSHIEAPIGLRPYSEWPGGESKADFVRRLSERLNKLPGIEAGVSQPIIDNVNELVSGAHSALVVKVFGQDLKEARRIADDIVQILRETPGTTQTSIVQEPPIPQIVFHVDRTTAARYGINVADVANLIQTGVGGSPIGQVYVNDRSYDVTVRFPPEARNSPEALGSLLVNTTSGAQIALSQIAKISLQNGESAISHDKTKRSLTVRVDYENRDLSSYLADAHARIDKNVQYDKSLYKVVWGGKFENQQRAQARLTVIVGAVLALMLVILFIGFGKLRYALLILAVVPLATLGGLVSLHLRSDSLNVATGVGFLALFGVAVQNGIIMVASLNRTSAVRIASARARWVVADTELQGKLRDFSNAVKTGVLEGAAERFRPVLMTSTVATVGMLPAAMATGVGSDVQRSLATVIVGGLIVATLLTLFILPTFYFVVEVLVRTRLDKTFAKEGASAQ